MQKKTAELLGKPEDSLNLVMCHLGNGASMAVSKGGVCIDTTMGLTPLEGLVMGTRSGDVDAGVIHFLSNHLGYSSDKIDKLLNKESGLLGLCGSSDWRNVCEEADKGNESAALARALSIQRIRKYLGAYLVKLDGKCDAVVFTGGIGENDANLRESVCAGLSKFGIDIDSTKNKVGMSEVQSSFASVKTLVVPTNEELSIALQSAQAAGVLPAAKVASAKASVKAATTAAVPAAATSTVAPLGGAIYIETDLRNTELTEAALLATVVKRSSQLGYFRLLTPGVDKDPYLQYMRATAKFGLTDVPVEAMYGMTTEEAAELYAAGKADEVFGTIVDKYKAYAEGRDFVLVTGQNVDARGAREAPGSSFFYAQLIKSLDIPAVIVHDCYIEGVEGAELEAELQGIKVRSRLVGTGRHLHRTRTRSLSTPRRRASTASR